MLTNNIDEKKRNKYLLCFLILTFIILFSIYYIHHQTLQLVSSDVTTMFPLLSDWLKGNILLKNWTVGTNSFFFTDTIWCIPGELLGLPASQIMSYTGALFHAGFVTIMLYVFIIAQDASKDKFTISTILKYLTYILIAGTVPYIATYVYLNLNGHAGAFFMIAIEFLLLHHWSNQKDRNPFWLIIYTIIGVLINASDSITLLVLFGPACIYSLYYLLWPYVKEGKRKKYFSLLLCNAFAAIGGKLFNHFIKMLGGLKVQGLGMQLLSLTDASWRVSPYIEKVYNLFGFSSSMWQANPVYGLFVCLLIFLIIFAVIWQLVKAVKCKPDSKCLFLSISIIINLCACIFMNVAIVDRYILSFPLFGIVLVIRTFNPVFDKFLNTQNIIRFLISVTCAAIAAVFCLYNTYVVFTSKRMTYDAEEMANYIQKEGLGTGYGDFWPSSLISSYTNFSNLIIPVFSETTCFNEYTELINAQWYTETNIHYIVLFADDTRNLMCQKSDVVNFIGNPNKDITIGQYELLYYNNDISEYLISETSVQYNKVIGGSQNG